MSNASTFASPTARQSDRNLGVIVAAGALLVIGAVWGWSRYAATPSTERPRPAWIGVNRVIAQMTDGRMLKVKVDLNVEDDDAVSALRTHQDAFRSLVEEVSAEMNTEDVQGPDAMRALAHEIQSSVNAYLEQQQVPERVKDVMFEEWTLLPSS